MVSTRHQAEKPSSVHTTVQASLNYTKQHAFDSIDFCTVHCWAENWGWYDPATATRAQFDTAVQKARDYLTEHAGIAFTLGKPLVLEEFGLARDGGSFDAEASDQRR